MQYAFALSAVIERGCSIGLIMRKIAWLVSSA
jgi:hypothetical protein